MTPEEEEEEDPRTPTLLRATEPSTPRPDVGEQSVGEPKSEPEATPFGERGEPRVSKTTKSDVDPSSE